MNGSVTYEGSTLLSGGIIVNPGANLEEITITENGTYYPSAGKDGFSKVVANVPQPQPVLDSINIVENGTYTPPEGTDGYNSIKVEVPQPQPVLDSITITENGTYTPPEGTDGYNSISVEVPAPTVILQDKTVTANGTYTADQGYDGLGTVTVNVPGNTYMCKNLVVCSHDGTYLGDVDITTPLTVGKTYMLLSYWENEAIPVKGGTFMVESGNTYINAGNKQFVVSQAGTKVRTSYTSGAGIAVSIMEIPDNLDVNPFV